MKNKVCVVTGSRAEYGLLKNLMKLFKESPKFELQIIATGMHLSPEFGLTYREIENDGFVISKKVEMLLGSDIPSSIAKSMGIGMIGFASALEDLKPDLVVVLGDRTEILSVASSCLVMQIPIAHLHGGETTEGAYDEAIRHSITKMAQLHFVAAEEYKKRVIQLGENPTSVHLVGGLGVDAIQKIELLNKEDLEIELEFSFGKRNLLITFHPVTLEGNSEEQMISLLNALDEFPDIHIIFTFPNSDAEGRSIIQLIKDYCTTRKNSKYYVSLGQKKYFSTIQFVDGVVGNSSSGLLEVPTFKKGTINIGNRQKGRLRAKSVIDCNSNKISISKSIEKLYSKEFQSELNNTVNPYGEGDSSNKIFNIIKENLSNISLKKQFYNL
jgi:GDP/UDP-N,N'-diacetylbacillosamine 2-epimerase (hydrolysing)